MLQKLYDIKFIPTRRLNQDPLEHFFGCIRQMNGPQDNPNSVTFKFCLRKYLLGKDIALVSDKTPTVYKEGEFDILQQQLPHSANS